MTRRATFFFQSSASLLPGAPLYTPYPLRVPYYSMSCTFILSHRSSSIIIEESLYVEKKGRIEGILRGERGVCQHECYKSALTR